MRQQENRVVAGSSWWTDSYGDISLCMADDRSRNYVLWPQLLSSLDGLFVNNNISQTSFYSIYEEDSSRVGRIDGGMSTLEFLVKTEKAFLFVCFLI